MGQASAGDLRKGMLVEIEGRACTVTHWNIWKNDRRSRIQMRFRDLLSGRASEATVQPDERFTILESEVIDLDWSYRDGPEEVFYDAGGEEWRCPADGVADVLKWNVGSYRGQLVDGRLVTVMLPTTLVAVVAETEPGIRGAGSGLKDAVLENGIRVKVGLLVNPGDRVRLDPETLEYKERIA